ncbi:unnamed protein product [Schistosoma turkestanicum]|nr:unnamed protein product [Schistosoma turkestanicum]
MELFKAKCTIDSNCITNKENPNRTPVQNEVNNLFVTLTSLLSHVNLILSYGVSHTARQEKISSMDLVNPPLLVALARASFACAMSTYNQTFQTTVRRFFANLTKYPDSVVSLIALSNYHQLSGVNISQHTNHEDLALCKNRYSDDRPTQQTRLVLPDEKCDVEDTLKIYPTPTKVSNHEQEEPPVKRLRITESHSVAQVTGVSSDIIYGAVKTDVPPNTQQKDPPTHDEQDTHTSDVGSYLTTFDPTFV